MGRGPVNDGRGRFVPVRRGKVPVGVGNVIPAALRQACTWGLLRKARPTLPAEDDDDGAFAGALPLQALSVPMPIVAAQRATTTR